jgi:hypothetical protein
MRFSTKEHCERVCRDILPEATIRFIEGAAAQPIVVTDKTPKVPSNGLKNAAAPPSDPAQPHTTKLGDKSPPTPYGFYFEFIRDSKPYAVRDANNLHVGIMCQFKSKTEAERYIIERERESAAAYATRGEVDETGMSGMAR